MTNQDAKAVEHHVEALSDACECILKREGLYSLSDPKDEDALARIESGEESTARSAVSVTKAIDPVDLEAMLKFGHDEFERGRALATGAALRWLAGEGRAHGVRLIVDLAFVSKVDRPESVTDELWTDVLVHAIPVKSIESPDRFEKIEWPKAPVIKTIHK